MNDAFPASIFIPKRSLILFFLNLFLTSLSLKYLMRFENPFNLLKPVTERKT